ncbi:diaminopimelate epimerase [Chloroflexota bacterium]
MLSFTKVQGAGNDFVLVESSISDNNWARISAAVCDRHFSIGADGLLLLLPSAVADFRMRVFNSDGSEADACGNGLRCLARYIVEKRLINSKTRMISIETASGIRKIKLRRMGDDIIKIQVFMGIPRFGVKEIPIRTEVGREDLEDTTPILNYPVTVEGQELKLNMVSVGNPHAVYFWNRPVSEFPMLEIGLKVTQLPLFPQRVNFEVTRVINRRLIEARVWERGSGETLACGSGACAIAVISRLYDYIDDKVEINLPGGTLGVEWDGRGEVLLSGPTEIVFTGEWQDENVKAD